MNANVIDTEAVYYLSGPMTGLPDYNYPYFEKVATRLRYLGLEVRSPHYNPPHDESMTKDDIWLFQIEESLRVLKQCDAIVLLPGWAQSMGVQVELNFALNGNYQVYYYLDPPGRLLNMSRRAQ